MRIPQPERSEIYFQQYIDQAVGKDMLVSLVEQGEKTTKRVAGWSDSQGLHRYAPGKWSAKEVLGHIADTERIFGYRLLWIARGGEGTLPGFDQDPFVENANFDARTMGDLAQELQAVRASSLSLLRGLSDLDWKQPVTISGNPMTPAHIPWLMCGHEQHHLNVLAQQYGLA